MLRCYMLEFIMATRGATGLAAESAASKASSCGDASNFEAAAAKDAVGVDMVESLQ